MHRILLLFLAFSVAVAAQQRSWHIDEHQLPNPIATLDVTQQRAISKGIASDMRRMLQSDNLEPGDIASTQKTLRTERVKTGNSFITLVQAGWGSPMCGATGNCAVWVFNDRNQPILNGASGKTIIVTAIYHHDQPDILFAIHDAAAETDLEKYRFDGRQYHLVWCATKSWNGITYPGKLPHVETHLCSSPN